MSHCNAAHWTQHWKAEAGRGGTGTRCELAPGEALSLPPHAGALAVTCVAGRLWVTVEGDGSDYVLEPGERFTHAGRGLVVVQALRPSRVELSGPAAAALAASCAA